MHPTPASNAPEALADAVRLSRLRLELERLKLANAMGLKVRYVSDAMVCKERGAGRHVLAK